LVLPVTLVKGRRKYWTRKSDFALVRCGDDAPVLQFGPKQKARAITIANPVSGSQGYVYIQIRAFFREQRELARGKDAVP
jgi:hypothetical protein